jgi:Methyltransferase domain
MKPHSTSQPDVAGIRRLASRAKHIICLDINADNIDFMRARFASDRGFRFVHNDGATLAGIADNSIDLAYSFDSMVHFDMEVGDVLHQ